jgi:hypothetical protein
MNQFTVVPNDTPQPTLDDLAAEHLAAKQAVAEANARLQAINDRIVEIVGTKDEGSFSIEGGAYKITTTQPLTRSVNKTTAQDVYRQLPQDLANGVFDWKPSLNLKLYRELEKYQPDYHALISKAVTTKPGKPQVKVVEIAGPEAA